MKIIIHNDDIGLTKGFTDAIKDSFLKGITTSTSLRPNGTAYDYSKKLLSTKLRKIGLGIHLNLTDGKPFNKNLENNNGVYKYGFFGYFVRLLFGNHVLEREIEKDFEAQFKKVFESKLKIDHINSERHIHMIPAIFKITAKLARKYKVNKIRITNEMFYTSGDLNRDIKMFFGENMVKFIVLKVFSFINKKVAQQYKLKTTNFFFGILFTDNFDEFVFEMTLKFIKRRNFDSVEILGHPAYPPRKNENNFTSKFIENYVRGKNRKKETKAFQSQRIKRLISKYNFEQISFRDL